MARKYKKRKRVKELLPRRGKCVNCHCTYCDPPPIPPHVPPTADSIRALRQFLGLNQVSFAQQLAMYKLTVSQWERGTRVPRREATAKLVQLAQMNGLDIFNMPEALLDRVQPVQVTVEKELQEATL